MKFITRTVVNTRAKVYTAAVDGGEVKTKVSEISLSGKLDKEAAEKEVKKMMKKRSENFVGVEIIGYDQKLYRCDVEQFMKIAEEVTKEDGERA